MNGIELRMHRLAKPYHGSGTPIGVHFTKNRPLVRRGERGWERWGGPLWNPVWGTGMPVGSFPASFGASVHRVPWGLAPARAPPLHPPTPCHYRSGNRPATRRRLDGVGAGWTTCSGTGWGWRVDGPLRVPGVGPPHNCRGERVSQTLRGVYPERSEWAQGDNRRHAAWRSRGSPWKICFS